MKKTILLIVLAFDFPVEMSAALGMAPPTRSAGSAYKFSFDKPANMAQVVEQVKNGIAKSGGIFSGDERGGSFNASGISGKYEIPNAVVITIMEKPFIVPNGTIEKEIKKFFGVK
jgi:hypothetical protein